MIRLLACFLLSMLYLPLRAQQSPSDIHQHTAPPVNARFEIVQSELAAKLTFRLDRFTGHIAQLVRTATDENAWEDMQVVGLPPITQATRPRFQIFTSGLAARFTFLFDTDTGKTWVVVAVKRRASDGTEYDVSLWQPFPE